MLEQDKLLWLISQTCLLNNVQISLKGKEYNVLGIIKHLSSVTITQHTKQYLIFAVGGGGGGGGDYLKVNNFIISLKTFKSKSNPNKNAFVLYTNNNNKHKNTIVLCLLYLSPVLEMFPTSFIHVYLVSVRMR